MTITSVEKTKNRNMIRIFIDNRYAFTIPEEDYIRNHLYEQEEIAEEKLRHIRENVIARAAREQAVRYLTVRDRSEGELIKKLTDAGYDSDVAASTAEALKAIGYINDLRYAMRYLSGRLKTRALSKKVLRYELKQKEISDEIIEKALSEFEIDDEQIALRAARKKFGKYDLNDQKIQSKVLRFLYHRGFAPELCKQVLHSMMTD